MEPLYLGLMSGTSADGIDAALVEPSAVGGQPRWRLVAFQAIPWSRPLATRIRACADRGSSAEICRLNFELGEAFAKAALSLLKRAKVPPARVRAIGSHGQTIHHAGRRGPGTPSTLQIGEPAVIAERTGILTIGDFRVADMAAGGEGAPLVPLADLLLFHKPGILRLAQNIGGIANVTAIGPDRACAFAFDTGPGNVLIDETMAWASRGRLRFDRDGRWAAAGAVDEAALREMSADPYFRIRPPKSTGRERFGPAWLAPWWRRWKRRDPKDLVATLTALTVRSIADAYRRFVYPKLPASLAREVILSGGGAKNPTLVRRLKQELAPVSVIRSDALGVPVEAREAAAFAILAWRTVHGLPGNLPAATGAKHPAVLGKTCHPCRA